MNANTDDFVALVKIAKLDKRHDFVGMNFSGMNLDGATLQGFNFTDSDFRGCSLKEAVFEDCSLSGAAFNFPPTVKDQWRRNHNFILANKDNEALDLMRTATNAGRHQDRRKAFEKLIPLGSNPQIKSFLRTACVSEKSKQLRFWLRDKLTSAYSSAEETTVILQKSIFQGSTDIEHDISALIRFSNNHPTAVATICRACAVNSAAIGPAAKQIGDNKAFQETLLSNLAYSKDYRIWIDSAMALRGLFVDETAKQSAFFQRISQASDNYEIAHLAEAAAFSNVRSEQLFQLCERGYLEKLNEMNADDFLFYCYFYEPNKYAGDVLYHSFLTAEPGAGLTIGAFAAYCFLADREFFDAIFDERGYFYVDPRRVLHQTATSFVDDYGEANHAKAKILAEQALKLSRSVKRDDVLRPEVKPSVF